MQMNSNIILSGRQADILGAMDQGNALAQQVNQQRQQNALAGFLKESGPALASGDTNALNELYQYDPLLALDITSRQQDKLYRQERDAKLDARADRQESRLENQYQLSVQQHIQRVGEEQALKDAQEAERLAKIAMGFHQRGDRAGLTDFIIKEGGNPEDYPWDDIPAMAQQYIDWSDIMKATQGPSLPSGAQTLEWRAKQAGLEPGTPEYSQFMLSGGKNDGLAIDVDPATGAVSVRQGAGAGTNRPMSEQQSKDAVYATRAEGALASLEAADPTALTDRASIVADQMPLGIGREIQSDQYQVARNASDEFLMAILRKDTGAAITSEERRDYGMVYLPQPGDGSAVLQQKAQARRRALEGLKAGMSSDAILAQERALEASGSDRVDTPAKRLRFNPETGDFE
ncbi:hypothetical protein NM680_12985 [Paracoccus sp. PS-1]|uniref:hypothetical protein n=1 Tax=Paracoccus sp. PS1 TaxID=2963938 RepID=UPI0027E4C8DD|nr:hypothetical protein [Paracoccus sp. PS1]MDQ7262707.1 hypothetical protein [Paracoccus sp. PS1]